MSKNKKLEYWEMNTPDFNRGYEMGFENGLRDEDMPWRELNEEESRGYNVGFREGWVKSFGGHHE